MQLKGLVRFFTVLLIIYSLYQLSFTWFVRQHEKKMEAKARKALNAAFPDAKNYKSFDEMPDTMTTFYNNKLKTLLDSTKDNTVTYGINGAVSYQKAKNEELNLGLDLQGGMNVTMEVEMTGLIKSLSGDNKSPNFLKAIDNANTRKANSDADYITLFIEEYKKLEPNKTLASVFARGSSGVSIDATDADVKKYLKDQADKAFENTRRILTTRIDQFGVAQPAIYPDPQKQIISVELPGVKDRERVRNLLQSTANLQFWECYKLEELGNALAGFDRDLDGYIKGTLNDTIVPSPQPTPNPVETTGTKPVETAGGKKPETSKQQQPPVANTKKITLKDFQREPMGGGLFGIEIKDTARFRRYLEAPQLRQYFPGDAVFAYGTVTKKGQKVVSLYVLKTNGSEVPPLEGDGISSASAQFQNGEAIVTLEMNDQGANKWSKLTKKSVEGQIPIAIVLDGRVYSAPIARQVLSRNSQIEGGFTTETAKDLANILEIGKLPAPAKIVQEQQVGPTLGAKAIRSGSMAFVISFIVIFLLMLVYYNTSGWVANIALILNLLFTVGILAGLGATLTAPGIAGLVLTIGMAVDTNVIIYERIKEELNRGKGYIPAINEGYRRSLPPVLDGHITILLTAIILFYFGLGPVKGFATTQIIGILLSLFCGILVSRWVTEWFTNKKKHLEYFTGVSRRVFKHAKFKFIEYRKVAYAISFVVLGLGVASFFNGFDYGVEFNGGRSYTVQFEKNLNPDEVEKIRTDLNKSFDGENTIIKTVGGNSRLDITTAYLKKSTAPNADSIVETALFNGLKTHLPQNMTAEKFRQGSTKIGKLSSKTVLPTISDDLKRGAVKATIFALLIIFLYILIRFRDWRYSLGTVIALLHDVLVTLIVFSFARSIVPFPLEIDQHFIAAVLTVIGFSMNDTVIVFDRIREYKKNMPGAPQTQIINSAINDTLSRTIMTSLTVFLTILILFLVGGEATKGFAFAMLVGVITGTYSSIFVAAPILVDLGGGKTKKGDTRSSFDKKA